LNEFKKYKSIIRSKILINIGKPNLKLFLKFLLKKIVNCVKILSGFPSTFQSCTTSKTASVAGISVKIGRENSNQDKLRIAIPENHSVKVTAAVVRSSFFKYSLSSSYFLSFPSIKYF